MEPQIIFAQEIYIDMLEYIDSNYLKSICLQIKTESSGVSISNVLGWQSESMTEKSAYYQDFSMLIESVKSNIDEIIDNRYKIKKNIRLSNFWININGKYAYNTEHSHPRCLFSAVFYVEHEPNMGNLILVRGDNEIDMFNSDYGIIGTNAVTANEFIFRPGKNKLVIFPSWYRHRVESNLNDKERISIAMNFSI